MSWAVERRWRADPASFSEPVEEVRCRTQGAGVCCSTSDRSCSSAERARRRGVRCCRCARRRPTNSNEAAVNIGCVEIRRKRPLGAREPTAKRHKAALSWRAAEPVIACQPGVPPTPSLHGAHIRPEAPDHKSRDRMTECCVVRQEASARKDGQSASSLAVPSSRPSTTLSPMTRQDV